MVTTNHTTLRMSGALNIEHLTALKLHVGVNAHGWAVVEGEAGENALDQLSGALAGQEQHILTLDESGAEKCLFSGVIREAELVRAGGYHRFRVELLSGTCLMDQEVRSRSFQDVSQTYSQVAEQVCAAYNGGAAICTVGEDKTLGKPVIQYRETDWEFLMRMASHCGGVLVPETHQGLPRIWFGFPDRSFTCEFPEDAYTSGSSQRYYELGGSAAGYRKADFFYYDVESPQLCDLGWYTVFKGQPFIISEKSARLERGELIFTYRLGRPGLGWGKMLYNEKISGMTLLGEVLETSRETLKLKLDIDANWNPGGPYPYTWRPETGNFMYCMPQVGTRVSLYCPNYDEKTAMAVNCVRTNGADCDRMSDLSKRSFVTEHGKEMNLYPNEMSLVNGAKEDILGTILVSDDNGISFSSQKTITILAKQNVQLETPCFYGKSMVEDLILAKVDYNSGKAESSYAISGDYDAVAQLYTGAEGRNCQTFPPYEDAPEESNFDILDLAVHVLAGIAAVAVVAIVCVGTAGLGAPALLGAIAIGSTFVLNKAYTDYQNGEISGYLDYILTGAHGGITGFLYVGGTITTWWKTESILKTAMAMLSGGGMAVLADFITQVGIIYVTDSPYEIDYFSLWSSFLGGSFAATNSDLGIQMSFAGIKGFVESRSNNDDLELSYINAIASGLLAGVFGAGALYEIEDYFVKDIAESLAKGAGFGTVLGKLLGTLTTYFYNKAVSSVDEKDTFNTGKQSEALPTS